jgi:hypothetical protein
MQTANCKMVTRSAVRGGGEEAAKEGKEKRKKNTGDDHAGKDLQLS